MIGKITRGQRAYGLLRYLLGPGKHEEHIDAHVIAAWDKSLPLEPDPGSPVDHSAIAELARILELPVKATGRDVPRHVWHCALRTAPEDPILTDEQWAGIARRVLEASGLAPADDPYGSRWVAVRHADDHIHLVATVIRQDGRRADHHNDAYRIREAVRQIEAELGLRPTAPADGTAAGPPTRAELGKTDRLGLVEPARATLSRQVRIAAAAASDQGDFLKRLEAAGVRVKPHIAPSGHVTGYAVAMPGHRTADGRPVWYGGSRLAPDLSLPRLRDRWRLDHHPTATGAAGLSPTERRLAAWRDARTATLQAAQALARADHTDGAAIATSLSDLITTASVHSQPQIRDQLRAAAAAFERAGRAPGRLTPCVPASGLRLAILNLERAGRAHGSGNELAATGLLVAALATAAHATARWYQARTLTAQHQAATEAVRLLRHAAVALGKASTAGKAQPARQHSWAYTVRSALTGVIDPADVLSDPAWPALRQTLHDLRAVGHDPVTVLRRAATSRELGTADSAAEVLTWRLRAQYKNLRPLARTARPKQLKLGLVPAPEGPAVPPPPPASRRPGIPQR